MSSTLTMQVQKYTGLNSIALKKEIVVFGSSYMSAFPFYELSNKCNLEHAIYNRSIENLSIHQALKILHPCVIDVNPEKVFLNLGETDEVCDLSLGDYKKIVQTLKNELPHAGIYLVSIPENNSYSFHQKLSALVDNRQVFRIDLSPKKSTKISTYKTRFKELHSFFRDNSISLSEIFAISDI